jgi:4-hydroxythreonine-4-phosphate dehydrogenase
MTRSHPVIAVTPGEPAGIGPDIVLALAAAGEASDILVFADRGMLADRARRLGLDVTLADNDQPPDGGLSVRHVALSRAAVCGRPDPDNARATLETLDAAIDACRSDRCAALVTGPLQKSVINDAGIPFTGHTEYLAAATGATRPVMMLVAGGLRVALATTHLPLREVPDAVDEATLIQILEIIHGDLQRRFGIDAPRIMVCGLNPHAGEGGHLGREEIEVIAPAVAALKGRGIAVEGPLPADTLFTPRHLDRADAVLAMFHDQGLPVLKYAGFGQAVNVTLGLPIIRTSVDHGTALDLAGGGGADAGSLRAALKMARQLAAQPGAGRS